MDLDSGGSMEDVEVDCVNVGGVDVGMEHDFLFRLRFFRFFGRSVMLLRNFGELALDHKYALAHQRIELDFLDNLCALYVGQHTAGGFLVVGIVGITLQNIYRRTDFVEITASGSRVPPTGFHRL